MKYFWSNNEQRIFVILGLFGPIMKYLWSNIEQSIFGPTMILNKTPIYLVFLVHRKFHYFCSNNEQRRAKMSRDASLLRSLFLRHYQNDGTIKKKSVLRIGDKNLAWKFNILATEIIETWRNLKMIEKFWSFFSCGFRSAFFYEMGSYACQNWRWNHQKNAKNRPKLNKKSSTLARFRSRLYYSVTGVICKTDGEDGFRLNHWIRTCSCRWTVDLINHSIKFASQNTTNRL